VCNNIIPIGINHTNTQPQSYFTPSSIIRFVTFYHKLFIFISAFKCTNSFSCKCTKLWILLSIYFLYKNHLDLCLQIWNFLKINQLYLQICLNILYVSFHWSSKNVKAFINVFEVSWKEPKIFTFLSSRFQTVPRAGSKVGAGHIWPAGLWLPIYALDWS